MGRRRVVGQKKPLTAIKRKSTDGTASRKDEDVVVIPDDTETTATSLPSVSSNIPHQPKPTTQAVSPVVSPAPWTSRIRHLKVNSPGLDPDDLLLSQRTEYDYEVGWNSNSPRMRHGPGVDVTDIIRRHAATKKQRPLCPVVNSPGLNNLWAISSPVSHHIVNRHSRGQRKSRQQGNSKAAAKCRDLLMKLAAASKNDVPDTGVAASVQVPSTSTPGRRSHRLTAGDSDDAKDDDRSALVLFSESDPDDTSATESKATTPPDTRSRPFPTSPNPSTSKDQRSAPPITGKPTSHKLDKSMEDLWTDDEFDSDSFLAATQDMFTSVVSPVFNGGSKRRKESGMDLERQAKNGRFCSLKMDTSSKPTSQWKMPNIPSSKAAQSHEQAANTPCSRYSSNGNHGNETGTIHGKTKLITVDCASKEIPKNALEIFKKPAFLPMNKSTVCKPMRSGNINDVSPRAKPTSVVSKPFTVYRNSEQSSSSVQAKNVSTVVPTTSSKASSNIDRTIAPETDGKKPYIDVKAKESKSDEYLMDPDTSISEDMLAALAEPDDLLDSQDCIFDATIQEEKTAGSVVTNAVKELPKPADQLQSTEKAKECLSSEGDEDSDCDLVAEDALLALLEAAETSQGKQPTILEASQFSVDIGSTFRPVMHSTQKFMPSSSLKTLPAASTKMNLPLTTSAHGTEKITARPYIKPTAPATSTNMNLPPKTLAICGEKIILPPSVKPAAPTSITTTKPNPAPKPAVLASVTNIKHASAPTYAPLTFTRGSSSSSITGSNRTQLTDKSTDKSTAKSTADGIARVVGLAKRAEPVWPSPSDSLTASQATCSRDQIERKRLEALQKRRNRLKLIVQTKKS